MIRSAKNLIITAGLLVPTFDLAIAQDYPACAQRERYSDALEHCVDLSPDDVIALGTVRLVDHGQNGGRKVVLHDEARGDIELLLTPSLIQAIDESPAESFEVEGSIANGRMTVKNLRPIE